jgi:hypothetical protein
MCTSKFIVYFIHQIHTNMFRPKFWSAFVCCVYYEYSPRFFETSVVACQWALCDIPEDSDHYHPKCCGIYDLFDDSVGGLHYSVSNCMIINRQWIGTDAAGSVRGLIWRSNSAFSCNRLRTTTQLVVWTSEIPNKALVMQSQCVYCNLGGWIYVRYQHEFQASEYAVFWNTNLLKPTARLNIQRFCVGQTVHLCVCPGLRANSDFCIIQY